MYGQKNIKITKYNPSEINCMPLCENPRVHKSERASVFLCAFPVLFQIVATFCLHTNSSKFRTYKF
jgi:hypothetical protein